MNNNNNINFNKLRFNNNIFNYYHFNYLKLNIKKVFLILIFLLGLNLFTGCKNKKPTRDCIKTSSFSTSTTIKDKSFLHGGYLEIENSVSTISCDVLIYPHLDDYTQITSIDLWNGFTLFTSRTCLVNLFDNSNYNLLIYMNKINKLVASNTNKPDYLKIPIESEFLDNLAAVRSKFVAKAPSSTLQDIIAQGSSIEHDNQILIFYERLKRQIFQSKKLNVDYKKLYDQLEIRLNDETINFLRVQQANNCAANKIFDDLSAKYPDTFSRRYQNMIEARSNGTNNSIVCFVYTDLIQFDGKFYKNDQINTKLAELYDKSSLMPKSLIERDLSILDDEDLKDSIAKYSTKFVRNNANRLLQFTQNRLNGDFSDQNTIKSLLVANNDEINYFNQVSANYFTKISFTKNRVSVWNRIKKLNSLEQGLANFARNVPFIGHHKTPFEGAGYGAYEADHEYLSLAGNTISQIDDQSIFSHIKLKIKDNNSPAVDQLYYFLLFNFKPQLNSQKNKNPFDVMSFGSFLLYAGQPVAVFLSKNNKFVSKSSNYMMSVSTIDFWQKPKIKNTVETIPQLNEGQIQTNFEDGNQNKTDEIAINGELNPQTDYLKPINLAANDEEGVLGNKASMEPWTFANTPAADTDNETVEQILLDPLNNSSTTKTTAQEQQTKSTDEKEEEYDQDCI